MSTNNICFQGEKRKNICGYPILSGAVDMHDDRKLDLQKSISSNSAENCALENHTETLANTEGYK